MTGWFATLASVAALGADVLLDGEVVCCDDDGRARFEWMASWRGRPGTGTVRYYPFDVLEHNRVDLRFRPCRDRLDVLADLFAHHPVAGCEPTIATDNGPAMWSATAAIGAEGVVG